MSSEELKKHGRDGAAYTLTLTFTDEDGLPVAPSALTYTVLNPENQVVNSRDAEPVASPSATQKITLTAADMSYSEGHFRRVIIDYTYDSTSGVGLAGRKEFVVLIDDIQEKVA